MRLYQSHSCFLPVWVTPRPFRLTAPVGYTKAIPAPCPCGVSPKPFLIPACVELYQSHSFTLWEREHVNILCYNLKALCSSVSLRSYCKIGNDCHLRRCTCIHTYTHTARVEIKTFYCSSFPLKLKISSEFMFNFSLFLVNLSIGAWLQPQHSA